MWLAKNLSKFLLWTAEENEVIGEQAQEWGTLQTRKLSCWTSKHALKALGKSWFGSWMWGFGKMAWKQLWEEEKSRKTQGEQGFRVSPSQPEWSWDVSNALSSKIHWGSILLPNSSLNLKEISRPKPCYSLIMKHLQAGEVLSQSFPALLFKSLLNAKTSELLTKRHILFSRGKIPL